MILRNILMHREPQAEPTLRESDVRSVVRLLGDVAALQGALADKRMHLMNGLAEIIGADKWCWSKVGEVDPARGPIHTVFVHGGFTEEEFIAHLKVQEHPDLQWLIEPLMSKLAENAGPVTRTGSQLDPENRLAQSDVLPLVLKAGEGPVLMSAHPTQTGQISGLFIARQLGREEFSPRESRIAHIILSEVGWLHDESWPEFPRDGISNLSPRLRTVLTLLLKGRARKQIADDLDISIHTLGDYIKEIYGAFRVHSQAELIRRFVEGDGGDRP